jgi:hypothetical protein
MRLPASSEVIRLHQVRDFVDARSLDAHKNAIHLP